MQTLDVANDKTRLRSTLFEHKRFAKEVIELIPRVSARMTKPPPIGIPSGGVILPERDPAEAGHPEAGRRAALRNTRTVGSYGDGPSPSKLLKAIYRKVSVLYQRRSRNTLATLADRANRFSRIWSSSPISVFTSRDDVLKNSCRDFLYVQLSWTTWHTFALRSNPRKADFALENALLRSPQNPPPPPPRREAATGQFRNPSRVRDRETASPIRREARPPDECAEWR